MPAKDEDEIARVRQELKDLQAAAARVNPPLHPRTMAIAQAKIVKLQHQIEEFERKLRDAKRQDQS
jgi:hypothetical protein